MEISKASEKKKMVINCINKSKFPVPQYETASAAGLDLRANLESVQSKFCFNADYNQEELKLVIKPGGRVLVPTGLFIALPIGYEAQVRPRSGLALKHGISVCNTPGTIDADYRGEIGVILINHGFEDFIVNDGDRIAQMVITRHEQAVLIEVDVLDETERGAGGFGSTKV